MTERETKEKIAKFDKIKKDLRELFAAFKAEIEAELRSANATLEVVYPGQKWQVARDRVWNENQKKIIFLKNVFEDALSNVFLDNGHRMRVLYRKVLKLMSISTGGDIDKLSEEDDDLRQAYNLLRPDQMDRWRKALELFDSDRQDEDSGNLN